MTRIPIMTTTGMTAMTIDRRQKIQKNFAEAPVFRVEVRILPHVSQRENFFQKTPFFRQRLRNLGTENTKQTVF